MDQDFTEWSSEDIGEWLGFLHSDLEQYGLRAQFLKLDGEQFEKLSDAKFLRVELGIKISSHVNTIMKAVKQRMAAYDKLMQEKTDHNSKSKWEPKGNKNTYNSINNFPQISPAHTASFASPTHDCGGIYKLDDCDKAGYDSDHCVIYGMDFGSQYCNDNIAPPASNFVSANVTDI